MDNKALNRIKVMLAERMVTNMGDEYNSAKS